MAVALYEEAASMGSPSAQFALASLHLTGLFGVARDVPRAVTLLYFAAASGSMEAQTALGLMHSQGKHTPKSCAAALAYLMPAGLRAAAAYWPNKPVVPTEHFRLDEEILEDPSHVKDTLHGRVQFIRNGASKLDADAQLSLARLMYAGVAGEQRDVRAALGLWEEAALQQAAPAMAALGHVHAEGVLDAVESLARRDAALLGRQSTSHHGDPDADPSPAPPSASSSSTTAATAAAATRAAHGRRSEQQLSHEAEAESLLEAAVEENHAGAATTLAIMLFRRHGILPRPNTTALLLATDAPSEYNPASTLSQRALHLEHADPMADAAIIPSDLPAKFAQSTVARFHDPAAASSSAAAAAIARAGADDDGVALRDEQSAQPRIHSSPALRKDVNRAVGLLRLGVEQSIPQALYVAALLRLQGLPAWLSTGAGLGRDFGKARSQLAAAARKGFLPAFLALARLDAHGIGADKSCTRAVSHLTTLTRLGRGQNDLHVAQRRLEAGDATGAAFAWTRAAALGIDVASWNLGVIADKLLAEEHAQTVVEQWNAATRAQDTGSGGDHGSGGGAGTRSLASRVLQAVDASLRLAARQVFQLGTSTGSSLVGPTASYATTAAARVPPRAQDAMGQAGGKSGLWQRVVAGRARARQAMLPTDTADEAGEADAAAPLSDDDHAAEVGADGTVTLGAAAVADPVTAPTQSGLEQALSAVSRAARARQQRVHVSMGGVGSSRTMTAGELLPDTARSPVALVRALRDVALGMFEAAAAGGGDTDAMLMLGEYTRRGLAGQAGRPEAAVPHLREAAERRDARALWTLAHMHEMGEGLPLDWHLAKRLYDDAQGASHEAAGPAWFGRTRLWLKTRILAVLPRSIFETMRPTAEVVLGPMPVGAARGLEAKQTSSWPVSAWEQMPPLESKRRSPADAAGEAPLTGQNDPDDAAAVRAGDTAAEAALAAIRARRHRASTNAKFQALSTKSILRAIGLTPPLAELGDTLSGGDPEIAVIMALAALLMAVLGLQVCRTRCC
jgi:TPR repeat protein